MQIYEELVARGLIAQVTNEDEIKKMINEGKATFYIGFDCTADSLTAGHFMALTLMKRLQMAGNKPIALIGGGTTMIGDPSGRTDMRKMLTADDINHNAECFKRQMERFIEFGPDKAIMLNNADWLLKLNYAELQDTLPLYSGNDDLTLPLMAMGTAGCISVLGNVLPHSAAALCNALLQDDLPAARQLHYAMLPLMKALFCEVNPIPVKAAMSLVGFPCGSCRMPLSEIEPQHFALLKNWIESAKQHELC